VAISLAGPAVHIAAGVAVLVAMGVDPLDRDSVVTSEAAHAIWWAGPVIGLLNLIPVLPLDGGNVVATVVDAVVPGRGRRIVLYLSLTATIALLVSTAFVEATRGLTVFVGFLLIVQLTSVFDDRRERATSPFDDAAAAMRAGREAKAVRILTRGLTRPSQDRVVPAEMSASPDDALARAVAALPRPLPHGEPWNEYLLATLLIRWGLPHEAAAYAAEGYHTQPTALAATAVARAAGSLGDAGTAAGWLQAARLAGLPDDQLRQLVAAAPDFGPVRASSEVQAVLSSSTPGASPDVEPRRT
jgi:hypothetical protein